MFRHSQYVALSPLLLRNPRGDLLLDTLRTLSLSMQGVNHIRELAEAQQKIVGVMDFAVCLVGTMAAGVGSMPDAAKCVESLLGADPAGTRHSLSSRVQAPSHRFVDS